MIPEEYCKSQEEHRLYHAIGEMCPCYQPIRGGKLTVPSFELVSNPTVSLAEIKKRRFNIVARAQKMLQQQVQDEFDKLIFATIDDFNELNELKRRSSHESQKRETN